MKLNTKFVVVTTVVLIGLVATFAFLNRDHVLAMKAAQESGRFVIRSAAAEYSVSMEDIHTLSPDDIRAIYKPNGIIAQTRIYQGVSLKALVDSLGIDYSEYKSVLFSAADGYASILRLEKAMDESNCYIVISHNNSSLGTLESGGTGPFMMILARDSFSQFWCKFLLEVSFR